LSFESADVQPVRASVWQVQPGGREEDLRNTAQLLRSLHWNCNQAHLPVKLAYAPQMFEDEEKRLVGGEIVLRGVTAFVGVGGGGGGIA